MQKFTIIESGNESNINNRHNNFDSGLLIGLKYQFNFGLHLESKYMYDLSGISDVEFPNSSIEHNYKNRFFQIGLGYDF